jgi:hypothetical protein
VFANTKLDRFFKPALLKKKKKKKKKEKRKGRKRKTIPVTCRGGPFDCKILRISYCLGNSLKDVG